MRGNPIHRHHCTAKSARMIGCRTCTPFDWAIAPMAYGNMAPPLPPNAAAKPILEMCRCFGRSFVQATIAAGNKGPRKKPMRPTETAPT